MIYKLSDGTRVRTRHMGDDSGTVEFERYRYTPEKETLSVTYLEGREAADYLLTLSALDNIRFVQQYGRGPSEILAQTGRPLSAVVVGAALATVAAAGFVFAPNAQAPEYPLLKDVVTAPVVTPTPVTPSPYRPEPRETTRTDREGPRETLTPSPSAKVAKPSTTPKTKHPIPTFAGSPDLVLQTCEGDGTGFSLLHRI
ncbi:hypothetical protein AB0F77_39770 [Streptomyces sp. NPDC026672]|uniref:hypothetical protein n=1 Tax=Actinomycetes TaxID=1760 RepID=UPI0033EF7061